MKTATKASEWRLAAGARMKNRETAEAQLAAFKKLYPDGVFRIAEDQTQEYLFAIEYDASAK